MPITEALIIPTDGLSRADVAAIREFAQSRRAAMETQRDSPSALGWTVPLAVEFAMRMTSDGRSRVRLETLVRAVHNGGAVDRDTVYAIAHYDRTRSLKGFTRPLRRHMAAMQREGLLPMDAAIPLMPIYDPNVASYQRTTGFEVPAPLVEVFGRIAA